MTAPDVDAFRRRWVLGVDEEPVSVRTDTPGPVNPARARADEILEVIDVGLQSAGDIAYATTGPRGSCWRCCQRRAVDDSPSGLCEPCRAFMLGDDEPPPVRTLQGHRSAFTIFDEWTSDEDTSLDDEERWPPPGSMAAVFAELAAALGDLATEVISQLRSWLEALARLLPAPTEVLDAFGPRRRRAPRPPDPSRRRAARGVWQPGGRVRRWRS